MTIILLFLLLILLFNFHHKCIKYFIEKQFIAMVLKGQYVAFLEKTENSCVKWPIIGKFRNKFRETILIVFSTF